MEVSEWFHSPLSPLTTFIIQKLDKPMIYGMIAIEADRADIMKRNKLFWNILFSNQKFGVSGVFRNL